MLNQLLQKLKEKLKDVLSFLQEESPPKKKVKPGWKDGWANRLPEAEQKMKTIPEANNETLFVATLFVAIDPRRSDWIQSFLDSQRWDTSYLTGVHPEADKPCKNQAKIASCE
jgi:hypothetical protein